MFISMRKSVPRVIRTAMAALVLSPSVLFADVVLDWNSIMQATVGAGSPAPFIQARYAALTQLAVFEAVNTITGEYKPYLGTLTAPAGASPEAAAIAAAHTVLKNYFPNSAASLDDARAASLAAIMEGPAKSAGIATGEAAARAVIALRANDGSAPPDFYLPSTSEPGQWQPTPGCPAAGGTFFQWRAMTPFALRSGDQFRLPPPPLISSARYARDYNEVKEVGSINSTNRSQDRSDVARFFAAVSGVGLWNPVARELSLEQHQSLSQNARALALLSIAMSDGSVAAFDTKYHYNAWRPETAIRQGTTDGNAKTNPDPSFTPYIVAPCFPGYPSAHATTSNAAREVLERLYEDRPHSFTLTLSIPAVPGVSLKYSRLQQITDDIDDARVYGGIHFRFEQEAGAELGRRIGDYVYTHTLGAARTCSCEED